MSKSSVFQSVSTTESDLPDLLADIEAAEANAVASAASAAASAASTGTQAANATQEAANAASSAAAAANSATTAANSATAAGDSETAASNSASTASGHANTASAAATTASGHANDAFSHKTDAETAETNALASQTAAAASATAAGNSETAAGNSETAAGNSETAAANSATAAGNSETAAGNSETAAGNSATAAGNSATAAGNSATAAANSATDASNHATTATTKAGEASTSAANAATSETNAAASETAAAASESAAAASETAAAASETAAGASETAAAASETAAAASETAAAASETAAATSETNAAGSATTATTQASTATTKATEASNSASSAATAQTAAEAARDSALSALDSFDDRYLGVKSSDPSLDNDGNALVSGALYFSSTDTSMKVYDGSNWLNAYASLSGALLANQNLSDLNNAATARTNLGLAAVASSGAYSDLTGTPTTVAGYGITDAFDGAYSSLTGAPSLATVATSGAYSDLSGTPTIPTNNNQLTNGAGYITSADGGNAATLDGIDSSQFLRSDAADTAVKLTFGTSNVQAPTSSDATTGARLILYPNGSGRDYAIGIESNTMWFNSDDNYKWYVDGSLKFEWDNTAGQFEINGNKVWHAGNDGSGSGLDADLLDGVHGSSFLRSDATDTTTGYFTVDNHFRVVNNGVSNQGDNNTHFNYQDTGINYIRGTNTVVNSGLRAEGRIGIGQDASTFWKIVSDYGSSSSGSGIWFDHSYSSGFKTAAYYGLTYVGRENGAGGITCASTYVIPGNGASGPGYAATSNTVDLGTSTTKWKNIYAGTAMYVGSNPVATTQFNTVGSYVLAHHTTSNASISANANIGGSSLRAVGFYHLLGVNSTNAYYPEEDGSALSGTWRAMGEARDNSAPTSLRPATLFVRIS